MLDWNLSMVEHGKMMREFIRVIKKRVFEQKHDEIKLSMNQFGLLYALKWQEDDLIQKDLAESMGKDKSAILRLIDTLEEIGLVRRVTDLNDRRKNCLMITKAGARVLEQYMKIVYDALAEIQTGLTQSEIDTFYKVIIHLKNNAEKL